MDPRLRAYATDRQWEVYTAVAEHGSHRKAARALGCDQALIGRTIQAIKVKAAKAGYAPEYDQPYEAPPGFRSRGVSTLYNRRTGEPILQWHKTAYDHEAQQAAFDAFATALAQDLPRVKPIKPPTNLDNGLMVAYPVGDHHHGMLSWHAETGGNWDLEISERSLVGAVERLAGVVPKAGQALVALLGDFFHFDGWQAVTPKNRNLLDVDGRFPKVLSAGIRLARQTIEIARRRHGYVHVIIERGNHDEALSVVLAICLAGIYENDPAVSIDTSPQNLHYHRFGKVLIGTTHGDRIKLDRLPLIMATDRPADWGETAHRYWYTGHRHHTERKDHEGVIVEQFPVLAPNDAHAHALGYRARRAMHAIVYHEQWGEIARHTFTPEMMEEQCA